jgi:hypothetical protein
MAERQRWLEKEAAFEAHQKTHPIGALKAMALAEQRLYWPEYQGNGKNDIAELLQQEVLARQAAGESIGAIVADMSHQAVARGAEQIWVESPPAPVPAQWAVHGNSIPTLRQILNGAAESAGAAESTQDVAAGVRPTLPGGRAAAC